MPWVWLGRFCFDLSRIELVERTVGGNGATLTLTSGATVDLSDGEAEQFFRMWSEYSATRGPADSRVVVTPVLVVPGEPTDSGHLGR